MKLNDKNIKPALRELHWLLVKSLIIFKVLLITFKIIHGLCPAYLSSLLQQYRPQRSQRSSSKLLFTVPTVNSVTYGERAFSFFAPILWNSLAGSVKNTTSLLSFKFALKTFLFREFFLKIILRGTVPRFHATQFLINYFIYFIYYCYKKHFIGFNQFIFF